MYHYLSSHVTPQCLVQGLNEEGAELIKRTHLTDDWLAGKLSNFAYLMKINVIAGRSLQDVTQYPVFPWILNNYTKLASDLQ